MFIVFIQVIRMNGLCAVRYSCPFQMIEKTSRSYTWATHRCIELLIIHLFVLVLVLVPKAEATIYLKWLIDHRSSLLHLFSRISYTFCLPSSSLFASHWNEWREKNESLEHEMSLLNTWISNSHFGCIVQYAAEWIYSMNYIELLID